MRKDKQKKRIHIEIVGITTCGTYPSWVDYTIASFYNHVNKIIVVNAGYDIKHPEKGAIFPLEREHELIQDIDINHKIIEVNPNKEQIDKIFKTTCDIKKDEFGRSTNMTLATQMASRLPDLSNLSARNTIVRYILKLDSDQILYQITRDQLINLVYSYPSDVLRFAQYADYLHNFEHIDGILPDEFTNDGALFYRSLPNQGYSGQGSPGYLRINQRPIYEIKTSHMRRINPPGVDPYEYHYKRLWYHTYGPNSIMEHEYNRKTGQKLTNEQIKEIAHNATVSTLQNKGIDIDITPFDERIPYKLPAVCEIGPLEYIKIGY